MYDVILGFKMVARIDAVAHSSSFQCSFFFAHCSFLSDLRTSVIPTRTFWTFGDQHWISVSIHFHNTCNISVNITRLLGFLWIFVGTRKWHRQKSERKQKQGHRSGILFRLRKQPFKPPLPSLYISNARSLALKMSNFVLQLTGNLYVGDCCVLIITETWLHLVIHDATMQKAGGTLLCWNKTEDLSMGL